MLTKLLYSFYTLQSYRGNLIFTYMPLREKRSVLPRQSIASNYASPPPFTQSTVTQWRILRYAPPLDSGTYIHTIFVRDLRLSSYPT